MKIPLFSMGQKKVSADRIQFGPDADTRKKISAMAAKGTRSEAGQVEHLVKLGLIICDALGVEDIDVVREVAAKYTVEVKRRGDDAPKDRPETGNNRLSGKGG